MEAEKDNFYPNRGQDFNCQVISGFDDI